MRLLVDLMGAQTHGSRIRGIGRYTRELSLALAKKRDPRVDLRFAVSENFPEAAQELRALLGSHVVAEAITSYATPRAPHWSALQSDPARRVGEAIVRRHVAGVRPDCLLASSLYEVAPDDFSYFDLTRQPAPLASCILYDLIPMRLPRQYLRQAAYRRAYEEQTAVVRSADLLFAISEHTKRDATELLGIAPERIVNIGGAADPQFAPVAQSPDNVAAILRRLGVRDRFIFCAAGADPRKNAGTALDAFLLLPPEARKDVQFVLLAPLSAADRADCEERVRKAGIAAPDVLFLPRVDDADLACLYQHAQLFVFPSLYEGFGLPVLEAMQCGAAIIAGDNSSIPEIADRPDVLCDMRSAPALASALARGLRNDGWRADVRAWGTERAKAFSWDATATRLQDALLDRAPALQKTRPRRAPAAAFALAETLETEVAAILRSAAERRADSDASLTPTAIAPLIARSASWLYETPPRRLLVDVTTIVASDRRTGIQRVVRNIVRALYTAGVTPDVVPVAVRLVDGQLRTCQAFVSGLLACPTSGPDAAIDPRAGDCLLMLDNSWERFADFAPVFELLRRRGGTVVTCVYDLIPERYAAASIDPVPAIYRAWLRAALADSDGIITISQAVMGELVEHIAEQGIAHRANLRVGWFQCGADIAGDVDRAAGAIRPAIARAVDGAKPAFLIVGTLEPRKGHWVALDAFDRLWARGVAARLLIVGSRGWHVDALIARMRAHPAFGTRLVWIDGASDAELAFAYAQCAALLNPSYAEGFGLPLAEAARAARPVLCSDIPVFREIGRDGAVYFRVNDPDALAGAVQDFLAGASMGDPSKVVQPTWADAARRITDVVMRGEWSATV